MKDQKIKVAMYFPFFLPAYGGAELATYNLAKELSKMCDVKLYTFNQTQTLNKEKTHGLNLSRACIATDIPIYRYSAINLPVVKNFSVKLIKDLNYSDENILHFQGLPRLFSRLLVQKAVKRKIKILTTHGLHEAVEIIRQSKLGVLINPIFLGSLKNLDHIIALSKKDVNLLLYLGINRNKVTLIPNGIDVKKFEKRRKFVKRNGKMKILCVARFDQNKNYECLVYALSKLKNHLEFEAYFIGAVTNYEYFKKIIRLIEKKRLEKFINIGMSLDDPALVDCYLSCDLFVLPSNMETFPLVILEAMYAGLPIIATHVGDIPDIVKNGVNGFVIPKNDSVKLYKRCLQLLKNEKMRKDMGTINKEIARNYTWSKITLSTYNLYQQLMEKIQDRCARLDL